MGFSDLNEFFNNNDLLFVDENNFSGILYCIAFFYFINDVLHRVTSSLHLYNLMQSDTISMQ